MTVRAQARALPKIELHLHLEGAIPLDALWALLSKYGRPPDIDSLGDLQRRFACRDFFACHGRQGRQNAAILDVAPILRSTTQVAST